MLRKKEVEPKKLLREAILAQDPEAISRLLRENPELCEPGAFGSDEPPLHYAVFYSNRGPEAVGALLDGGMPVDWKDERGRTALHLASKAGIVERLLLAGADVNIQDADKKTPLHSAIGYPEIVRLLLEHGADPTVRNKQGLTPADIALAGDYNAGGHWECARLLGVQDVDIHRHISCIGEDVVVAFAYANPDLAGLLVRRFERKANDIALAACLGNKGNPDTMVAAFKQGESIYIGGIVSLIWDSPLTNKREILLALAEAFPRMVEDFLWRLAGLAKREGCIDVIAKIIALFPEGALELLAESARRVRREGDYWLALELQRKVADALPELFALRPKASDQTTE